MSFKVLPLEIIHLTLSFVPSKLLFTNVCLTSKAWYALAFEHIYDLHLHQDSYLKYLYKTSNNNNNNNENVASLQYLATAFPQLKNIYVHSPGRLFTNSNKGNELPDKRIFHQAAESSISLPHLEGIYYVMCNGAKLTRQKVHDLYKFATNYSSGTSGETVATNSIYDLGIMGERDGEILNTYSAPFTLLKQSNFPNYKHAQFSNTTLVSFKDNYELERDCHSLESLSLYTASTVNDSKIDYYMNKSSNSLKRIAMYLGGYHGAKRHYLDLLAKNKCANIEHISVSDSEYDMDNVEGLAELIQDLQLGLKSLSLSNFRLQIKDAQALLQNCNTSLTTLNLSQCQIENGVLLYTSQIPTLKHLTFEYCENSELFRLAEDDQCKCHLETCNFNGYVPWDVLCKLVKRHCRSLKVLIASTDSDMQMERFEKELVDEALSSAGVPVIENLLVLFEFLNLDYVMHSSLLQKLPALQYVLVGAADEPLFNELVEKEMLENSILNVQQMRQHKKQ